MTAASLRRPGAAGETVDGLGRLVGSTPIDWSFGMTRQEALLRTADAIAMRVGTLMAAPR